MYQVEQPPSVRFHAEAKDRAENLHRFTVLAIPTSKNSLERVTKPSQDSRATLKSGAPRLTFGLPTIREGSLPSALAVRRE
jgi:hypothetical protein